MDEADIALLEVAEDLTPRERRLLEYIRELHHRIDIALDDIEVINSCGAV